MSENTQSQLEQIAALIDAWRSNDSLEGELSPRWVLGQIREAVGLSDLDYLTRALSSLLTEAGESPHPNPAELVTQIGTVMRRARRPMTSQAPLTEEEAQRWADGLWDRLQLHERDAPMARYQVIAQELLKVSRGEIPPEVRPSGICACGHGVNMHLDEKGACRAGWATDARGCMCDGYSGVSVLTPAEEAEIIASAPGTIAPGQRPISAPIDPDSGTRERTWGSSGEWPSWAQGEGAIVPPLTEMAVTIGTDNDDNP